ncbi:uncharacterized protein A4U43_C08F6770 [Asparagus officinalis]|nr:uncharacterized protein A4U43_C08F6770 [Asparagus officinalis]
MHGLSMETERILLEEPSILCSETFLHTDHSFVIWNNVLGSRNKKEEATRFIQCNGFHVLCCPAHRMSINASSVQPVVSIERNVFYRERAAGMYSALPYAFGQKLIVYEIVKF